MTGRLKTGTLRSQGFAFGANPCRACRFTPFLETTLFIPFSPSLGVGTHMASSESAPLNLVIQSNDEPPWPVRRAKPAEVDQHKKQVLIADPSDVKWSRHNTTTSYGIGFMLADAQTWDFAAFRVLGQIMSLCAAGALPDATNLKRSTSFFLRVILEAEWVLFRRRE